MSSSPDLFLFAGERSGDLHGAVLLEELQQMRPSLKLFGVGGPKMREKGFSCILQSEQFEVMGFFPVLKALPRLLLHFYQVRNAILTRQPKGVVLIDYPGFNLRLAKSLRKKGYRGKIIQYICPSIWAHGKERIAWLTCYFDLLLTIYPFESSFFAQTPLAVQYIGNPLVEAIIPSPSTALKNDLLIALFPGSRRKEIEDNLPLQLATVEKMVEIVPELQVGLSLSAPKFFPLVTSLLKNSSLELDKNLFLTPSEKNRTLMQHARVAIAKSGTVNLELALHQCPTVVTYPISSLSRWIAKHILKLKLRHYSIVNILAGKELFPEFIEEPPTPEKILTPLLNLYQEGETRSNCIKGCQTLIESLKIEGEIPQSSRQAALAILKVISP